jgi:hypothetical protein
VFAISSFFCYYLCMRHSKKVILALAITYTLFISIFALDAIADSPIAFIMHLVPTFILVAAIMLAWRNSRAGGIAFIVLGIVFTLWFHTFRHALSFMLLSVPLVVLGTLFLYAHLESVKKLALYVLVALLLVACMGFVGSIVSIGFGVRGACITAQEEYSGDCVEALSAYIDLEDQPLHRRGHAVWAAGQFGDPRALPVLEKYYTGEGCDHTNQLCQYELEKAIKWCKTNKNILSPIWQWLFL